MSLFTPEGVLSYPKVFEPERPKNAQPGDKAKWSTTILFTKEQTESPEFKELVAAAIAQARETFGAEVSGKIEFSPQGMSTMAVGKGQFIKLPFRKNVGKWDDNFVMFLNVNKTPGPRTQPVQVVSRSGKAITDREEIFPGVRARLSLSCFGYNRPDSKGVSFGLNNVQKLGDGPRIDNFKSAEEEFGALPEEAPGAMPDMESLLG